MDEENSAPSVNSTSEEHLARPVSPELEKLIAALSVLQKEELNAREARNQKLVTLSDSDGDDYLKMQVELLFEGLPQELRSQANELYQTLYKRRPSFNNAEIYRYVRIFTKTLRRAYLDQREYLRAFSRRYVEERLFDAVAEVISREDIYEEDLSSIARIHMDMRGLYALNELSSHVVGNKALERFMDMLKIGVTTEWIRSLGFEVVPSAERRDQFGILILGKTDLRPYIHEIAERYVSETEDIDCRDLVSLSHPGVKEKIKIMGYKNQIPNDLAFRISTSLGYCLLGEVIEHAKYDLDNESSYAVVIQGLKGRMFSVADKRALVNQSEQRERLEKGNPVFALLYSRMEHDVIELENSLIQKERKLRALEHKIERDSNPLNKE